jgi:hypothetical protein
MMRTGPFEFKFGDDSSSKHRIQSLSVDGFVLPLPYTTTPGLWGQENNLLKLDNFFDNSIQFSYINVICCNFSLYEINYKEYISLCCILDVF